jgi:hypothetical protein
VGKERQLRTIIPEDSDVLHVLQSPRGVERIKVRIQGPRRLRSAGPDLVREYRRRVLSGLKGETRRTYTVPIILVGSW